MRRFTSLLALFVLFVTSAAAQFSPTTFKGQGIVESKLYNLSCVRGCLQVNADGFAVLDRDLQNPDDQSQVVQFKSKPESEDSIVYIYSPTNGKYLTQDAKWVSTMAEANPVYLFTTTYTKDVTDEDGNVIETQVYPYGISFYPDYTTKNFQVNGVRSVECNGWATPDDGSAWQITESNLSPDDIDVMSSLIEGAQNTINTYGMLPTLFPEENVENALDAVYEATTPEDIDNVIKSLKKTAAGKTFTLHSMLVDGRFYGFMRDNGGQLATDSLSFESEFTLEYNDSLDLYALKNIYTGRYVQDVSSGNHVYTDTIPRYFKLVPYSNDTDEPDILAIGQDAPGSYIHNSLIANGITGWYNTEVSTEWKLGTFDSELAAQGAIEAIDKKSGNHWGDYANTDEFQALKDKLIAEPTAENYKAVLASQEVVSGNIFINIHSAYKNEADSLDYTGYSISLAQIANDHYVDSTYQHIQALGTDLGDPFQIWKVTSVKQGYVRFYSPEANKYIGPNINMNYNSISLSDEPVDWQITWVNDSTFQLYDGGNYMNFENAADYFGNINKWYGRDQWIFKEVNTLPITASVYGDKAYTTACYPFDLTLDKGTAYRAKVADDGNKLNLVEVGSTIPAGTPVIIETAAADKDITATINGLETSAEINEPFWIQGTYFPVTATDSTDILVFGQKDNVPGFYHFNRIVMNGAYLPYSGTLDGLTLGDVVDAIEKLHVDAIPANAPRYNLAGQRVGKDYKGVVIVNGKKFIQK